MAGWIPIFSGLLMFLSSIVIIFFEQFGNASKKLLTWRRNKKKRRDFYELHRYISSLDKNVYHREIGVVQFPENMGECVQWKKQKHWMEENHVDVESEFPQKVKENDEMMEKLEENNRLQYMRILDDVVQRK